MARQPRFRACPLCEAICGLELQYEGEALVAIRGDAADPFSQGHVCPKGNAILDLEADPDRLRQPMRRRGSEWEQIGWEEALAEAGERLAAVQAVHGADAVAAYLGNPNVHHFGHIAYLPALLKSLRSRNIYSASSVDQWPHQLVDWLMYGHQFLLPIPDIDHTDYFLMLGANPVASNGSLMTAPGVARRLEALARRGQLVVVDPRRTETAGIANQHLFIRPGSDAWFLLALIQDMLALGPPRIAAYAGKLNGLDEALAAIQSAPTQDVQARTGIPRSDIRAVAEAFLAAPRAVAYGRMGVSTQAWGTLCQWLIQMVNLVSGNLDRVGGALPNEPALPLTGPGTSPGHRDRWRSRVSGRPEFAGELPVAVLAEEIRTPGPGQVRALLTCAGNPVLSTPDGRGLDAALASLDYMVSIDIYLNETTRHANLILPPASPLTQPHYDAHFNAFAVRRVARLSLPLRERKEDERADWEIINALGAAHAGAAGKAWQALPPPLALLDLGLKRGGSGLDVAQLAAAPHGLDLGPLRPSLLSRLETASGCIECAPALVLAELASLQARPADGQALRLIGQRHVRSNNSWMHNAPRLVKGPTRHELRMHPDDLAKRGIASGSEVILESATGSVRVTVLGDAAVMPGVACLPHGFGHQRPGTRQRVAQALAGASYNDLSSPSDLDQASGNAALNGIPVTVTAA